MFSRKQPAEVEAPSQLDRIEAMLHQLLIQQRPPVLKIKNPEVPDIKSFYTKHVADKPLNRKQKSRAVTKIVLETLRDKAAGSIAVRRALKAEGYPKTYTAVNQLLAKLTLEGKLARVGHGVYKAKR